MQLAQIVHYHGYPRVGDSINGRELQKKIKGGKLDRPKIPDCNKLRYIEDVSGFVCRLIIDRVYALDPVGTYWFRTLRMIFGLNSKTLPPGVRARVILMAGEGKLGFQPNIYTTESAELKQVL